VAESLVLHLKIFAQVFKSVFFNPLVDFECEPCLVTLGVWSKL